MRIALVSLKSPFLDDDMVYPSISPLYLKSYIEWNCPEATVDLVDNYDGDTFYLFHIYDIVGISSTTSQYPYAKELMQSIKSCLSCTVVVIGGAHPTYYSQECLKDEWDYVVVGDGEKSMLEIVNGIQPEKRLKSNQLSADIITSLSRPDRTSYQAMNYLKKFKYQLQGRPATVLMTARGCPMKCKFCEAAGTEYRPHNLLSIVNELDDIKKLGFGGVYIFDDTFTIDKKRCEFICQELKRRDLIFRCNGHAKLFTPEFAKMLADNGCVQIAFGFETGSDRLLSLIGKGTTVNQNEHAAMIASIHIDDVKGFLMLGLPSENWDTIKATEDFMESMKEYVSDWQVSIFMPYKGTQIRDNINAYDLRMISREVTGAYGTAGGESVCGVSTSELSQEDLQCARDYLVRKFKPKSHEKRWKNEG